MNLSEAIRPAIRSGVSGNDEPDFSFLEEFACLGFSVNPRMTLLEGIIEKGLKTPSRVPQREIERVVCSALSLLGGTTSGLAVRLPSTTKARAGMRTVALNLASHLALFALETDAIGEEEFDILDGLLRQLDHALMKVAPTDWPELPLILPGNECVLLKFHLDLAGEDIYGQLVPYWQRAISAKIRSGNLVAPSSLNAFLTPLRHFTKEFLSEDLPDNLHHMISEERGWFARRIKSFFDDPAIFSLSRRTREDYASTVILAMKADPGLASSTVWSWKYSSHVARLDTDPAQEEEANDGNPDRAYLEAVRKTAESMDDPETIAFLQSEPHSSDTPVQDSTPGRAGDRFPSITHRELALIHHYSSERYAMSSFHSPFRQDCLSMHVICTFDHWMGGQAKRRDFPVWALLFHLLLVTGRSLDWVLSIRIGPIETDADDGNPFYDPATSSIITDTMMKVNLPRSPAADGVRHAYLPTSHRISIPVSAQAREWIEKIHGKDLRADADSLLLILPDRSPITKTNVQETLLEPFANYMLSRQPGLPRLTLGRIRKSFWSLFTWQGLSPEDATMISDQYYLDVRAPMFYACRHIRDFHRSYRDAYSAVGKSLLRIYDDLFPKSSPLTFSAASDCFQSAIPDQDIYFGSCYCPRPEKLRQLIAAIMLSLGEEWESGEARRRHDLLSYACAFGISLGLGLRVGETAGLTFQSVDHRAGTIAVNGKSDRFFEEMRVLPIPGPLREPLIQLAARRTGLGIPCQPHSPFFQIFQRRTTAVPLTRERLWRQLRLWEEKAGLDEAIFRWHALRHEMASHLLQDGTLTFPERSYFLGHVAGQQWMEDLQPGEQQIIFDQFASVAGRMMTDLGFDLTPFLQREVRRQ